MVGLAAAGGLLAVDGPAPAADGPAAAAWSAPSSLAKSPRGTRVVRPGLAFAARGAIATWRVERAVDDSRQYAAALERDGGLGPRRELSDPILAPLAYGDHRVVALVDDGDRSSRVRVVFGSTSGRFGRAHTILRTARGYYGSGTRITADRRGRVAVVHRLERRDGSSRVVLVERRAGGRFGRPTLIAEQRRCRAQICPGDVESGYGTDISVAIGPRGGVVVAWQHGAWVDARVRRAGERMGPITRIGRYDRVWSLATAMSARGAAWVAWYDHPVGGERSGYGPMSIRAATRPAGARRFGALREPRSGRGDVVLHPADGPARARPGRERLHGLARPERQARDVRPVRARARNKRSRPRRCSSAGHERRRPARRSCCGPRSRRSPTA